MDGLPPNTCDPASPTRRVLDLIGDKWVMLIVGLLENEPQRYGALQRRIGGISHTMLTQTLRSLERNGVVQRVAYAERPPRVEYSLTTLGQTLCKPIAAIRAWVEEYIHAIAAAQEHYDKHALLTHSDVVFRQEASRKMKSGSSACSRRDTPV